MEALVILFFGGLLTAVVVFIVALVQLASLSRRVGRMEQDVQRLEVGVRQLFEREAARARAGEPDVWAEPARVAPAAPPVPAAAPPEPVVVAPLPEVIPASAVHAEVASPEAAVPAAPRPLEPAWVERLDTPPRAASAAAPPPQHTLDAGGLEQLIGGVWLQNLGAVVLLVGVFLMILWGYTTHRFGPGVLVAAGVVLGLGFVWRGDRVARRVPAFGHALIGVGFGIVYLTLHLGYVRLHVLTPWLAFPSLVLVSVATMLAGLRYRVQLIAALGVIGAFLPQFLGAWLSLPGLSLPPAVMIGYLGAINVLVFTLAARAGWSALDLASLVLSAFSWVAAYGDARWGWGTQAGLSALFTLLGLAPLPRLSRVEGRVRPIDLAVVAVAPLALLVASAPFAAYAERGVVAMFLFSLSAVTLGAALWVDARRPERDLWMPLTGAATLYLTAGLERLLGLERTATAWCVEGVVLLWLGLRERGGWLRLCGTLVALLGTFDLEVRFAMSEWTVDQWPVFHLQGLSQLACTLALLTGAGLLARGRHWLTSAEKPLPELWTLVGHGLLMVWIGSESAHVAQKLTQPGSAWMPVPPPPGVAVDQRAWAIQISLTTLAWMVQSAALTLVGSARGRGFLRALGGVIGVVVVLTFVFLRGPDGWATDQHPLFHFSAMASLVTLALMAVVAVRLAAARGVLTSFEDRAPEMWGAAACLMLLLWSRHEAGHLAWSITAGPGPALGPSIAAEGTKAFTLRSVFTDGAWLLQAVALLVLGWTRGSAFLRWCGLALVAITLLRFVIVDLQTVDVFWRFLTAIVVGAAMLGLSYVYQRRTRAAGGKT